MLVKARATITHYAMYYGRVSIYTWIIAGTILILGVVLAMVISRKRWNRLAT